jgi:hypothetical protein
MLETIRVGRTFSFFRVGSPRSDPDCFGEVRTVRGTIRIALVVVTLAGMVTLGLPPVSSAPAPATQTADLKRAAVVLAFFDALNRSDAASTASAFAEKGFMIGAAAQGLCSLVAPCYDQEKIRANMDALTKIPHLCETVTSLQVIGSFVIGRVEVRQDGLRANGIERIVQSFMAQVLQDKIVVYFGRNDVADPETARNLAIAAGTQPKGTPITVVPLCG